MPYMLRTPVVRFPCQEDLKYRCFKQVKSPSRGAVFSDRT